MVSGAVHVHSGYNAWGSVNHQYPIPTNSDSFLKFGFNARWGYVSDASTGLSYCQNRYYDPQTGRFLTRDPIGYAGGANLYGYCGGNPVMNADPWGQKAISFEDVSNFFAGWGDNLNFGGTKWVRRAIGEWSGIGDANEAVDYDSGWYAGGEVVGTVHSFALGAAGGWKLGAKAVGREFSHFIPKRMLVRFAKNGSTLAKKALGRVWWNGNFVTPQFHSLTDPFRFLKKAVYGDKVLLSPILRYPLRVPFPISMSLVEGGASMVHNELIKEDELIP